jgi:hypothetical protein
MDLLKKIDTAKVLKLPQQDQLAIIIEHLEGIIEHVNKLTPKGTTYDGDFVQWYEAYPRKAAKPDAYRAWLETEGARPPLEELMTATTTFALNTRNREKKYIPHPATWLRREGWSEDISKPIRECGMTPVHVPGPMAPNPELMIQQQAPDWSHHSRWQVYVQAVETGKTALEFEEWYNGSEDMRKLFDAEA